MPAVIHTHDHAFSNYPQIFPHPIPRKGEPITPPPFALRFPHSSQQLAASVPVPASGLVGAQSPPEQPHPQGLPPSSQVRRPRRGHPRRGAAPWKPPKCVSVGEWGVEFGSVQSLVPIFLGQIDQACPRFSRIMPNTQAPKAFFA